MHQNLTNRNTIEYVHVYVGVQSKLVNPRSYLLLHPKFLHSFDSLFFLSWFVKVTEKKNEPYFLQPGIDGFNKFLNFCEYMFI